MMIYEGNDLTERELELYWDVLVDAEDTILKLIKAKDLATGVVFYEGLTIVYQIDSEGDASVELISRNHLCRRN